MEGLLTGWWRGDAGGVGREGEREERGGERLGEVAEGEDGGGVGMERLGLGRPEFGEGGEEDELDKEAFGLMMEGEAGPDFLVAGSS